MWHWIFIPVLAVKQVKDLLRKPGNPTEPPSASYIVVLGPHFPSITRAFGPLWQYFGARSEIHNGRKLVNQQGKAVSQSEA